jgi:hypothetical protein
VIAKRFDDLQVAELEHRRPRLDDRHGRPERCEHRAVFDPDHARADDEQRVRNAVEVEDLVGVEHDRTVELDVGRMCGELPVAITIDFVVNSRSSPFSAVTRTVFGSTTAARRRSFAAWIAARVPVGPEPIATRSNSPPTDHGQARVHHGGHPIVKKRRRRWGACGTSACEPRCACD